MNTFDVAVCAVGLVAIVSGFKAGLLRSVATMMGYVIAMPVAVAATPHVMRLLTTTSTVPAADSSWFFAVFLGSGIVLGALLRAAVNETVGETIGVADRLAGALLGASRVLLVAITLVLAFDRIILPGRQPVFLAGSRLQPLLLKAGPAGLKSLPPDVTALIDQLKSGRRI